MRMLYKAFRPVTLFAVHIRMLSANVNPIEVEKFGKEAAVWWEKNGALLKMNEVRVPYIRDGYKHVSGVDSLKNINIADVGCGGGFLSEALARTGAVVTGVEPSSDLVTVAKAHMLLDPSIGPNLSYENCTVNDLVKQGKQYDIAVTSEVVEHVADVGDFLTNMTQIVKPGGSLFVTTINRTTASYWIAIILAEKVLRFVSDGTHSWEQFVTPSELTSIVEKHGLTTQSIQGTTFNPLFGRWSLTSTTSVTYMAHFVKPK